MKVKQAFAISGSAEASSVRLNISQGFRRDQDIQYHNTLELGQQNTRTIVFYGLKCYR